MSVFVCLSIVLRPVPSSGPWLPYFLFVSIFDEGDDDDDDDDEWIVVWASATLSASLRLSPCDCDLVVSCEAGKD